MILFKEGSPSSFDMDNSLGGEKQDSVTHADGSENDQISEFELKSDDVDADFEDFERQRGGNSQTKSDPVDEDFSRKFENSQLQNLNSTPEILTKRINPDGSWEFLVKTGLIQEWKKRGEVNRKLIKSFESKARANRSNRRSRH
jgi:hypothetical protein